MNERILIIEDEKDLVKGLKLNLEDEGYRIDYAYDGIEGFRKAVNEYPDLIILDIMLPGKNGLDVCKELRQKGNYIPIIMLTAKSEEIDKVVGLEIGADDYMAKPFSIRELMARIKVQLRREKRITKETITVLELDEVRIDFSHFKVIRNNVETDLTSLEDEILSFMYSRNGRVISRDELLENVWGYEKFPTTRTVDNHILKIRKKIEKDPNHPKHLLSVYGEGYRFIVD
jgi:two-component system alkaline phosphatase synthesis response regulator PhoP